MRKRTWSILAVLAVAALAVPAGAAVIEVDGIASWRATSNTITGTFDASGSDKLVVVVTGEHGFPASPDGKCTSVTYDGADLTLALQRSPIIMETDPDTGKVTKSDQIYNTIWYLDNPSTSTGTIVAQTQTRGSVAVFALSNTALGFGATAISGQDSRSVDLTTTSNNSLVIASFGLGGYGNTGNPSGVTADLPLTLATAEGNSWDGQVTGYALVPTAGTGSYSFTGGNVSGAHVVAVEFTPEPATLGLLAIGGLGVLRRRRRA